MSAVGLKFCLSEDERSSLINDHGWSFSGDSKDCSDYSFMTTWKTDNPGTSASTEVTIPTFAGETYSYDVDWESDVSNMEGLFSFANYNGDLSLWDVSQVTNTVNMFRNNPAFDGDLSLWDMGMV